MGQSKAALPCCSRWVLHIVVRTCVVVQPYVSPLGSTRRCWALCVAIGLYASPLGSMCRRWALCIAVGLYALPLGPTCRSWALCVVVGPYSLQLGSMPHWLTLLIAVAPYVSWLGSMHCCWALLVAIGPGMSSWGPLPCRLPLRLVVCRCWALHVVVMVGQPGWALAGCRGGCYTGGRHCVGFNGISWGQGKSDERKRATTFVVAHSCDTPTGPPTCWVPPCVLPTTPPSRARSSQPTSLWRGEGRMAVVGSKLW